MTAAITKLSSTVLWHATESPNDIAVVDANGEKVSYEQLDSRSSLLANELVSKGVRTGARVVIAGEQSIATVISMIGVLRAGATYCVLGIDTPTVRWSRIRTELDPAALVITENWNDWDTNGLPVVTVPTGASAKPVDPDLAVDASTPAYVMFTSGSTGHPKGVAVGHSSVLAMIAAYDELAPGGDRLEGALVARPAFDVSVWEIFSVLSRGGTLHILSREALIDGHTLWGELVEREITSSYIPPGLLATFTEAAVQYTGPRPALNRILIGVEPIPAGIPTQLMQVLPGLRVVNGYGPTEATICATLHLCSAKSPANSRTPIGKAVKGSVIDLIDDSSQHVPVGGIGEIVVSGACLALGYLRAEDEVGRFAEGFRGRSYYTGDLAKFLPDGSLEFVGRIDDQLKVNGVRIEPTELEHALVDAPGVRRAVVAVSGESGNRRMIAVVEGDPVPSTPVVRSHLESVLPPYMLPSRVLTMRQFPLTANGKIDAEALILADRQRPADGPVYAPSTTDFERKIVDVVARLLGLEQVGVDDDLFWLGASSLDVLRLCTTLKRWGHRLTPAMVAKARTVRNLASSNDTTELFPQPPTASAPGIYPTTRGQQGLWAWRELHPDSVDTTIVHSMRWEPAYNTKVVLRAFGAVVRRQEALRTTFETRIDGSLVQRIHSVGTAHLVCREVKSETEVGARVDELSKSRLNVGVSAWRAELLQTTSSTTLIIVADHLIMDGESCSILEREVEAALQNGGEIGADPVPGLAGIAASSVSADVQDHDVYWRDVLDGWEESSVLPEPFLTDPGSRRTLELRRQISAPDWAALKRVAASSSTTPIIVILAILDWLLTRRYGNSGLICLAVSRRVDLGLEDSIGNSVNIVPIAIGKTTGTFIDHLRLVRETADLAIEHAATPFEDMTVGNGSRPPVPDLVLAQHVSTKSQQREVQSDAMRTPRPISRSVHGVTVFVEEPIDDRKAIIDWTWDDAATLPGVVPNLASAFVEALAAVTNSPDTELDELPYLAAVEKELIDDSRGESPDPVSCSIVDLFDEQLRLRPEAIAVQWSGGNATYAELEATVAYKGSVLRKVLDGRSPGVIAVVLEKGIDLIASLLAVLRAGGAYLPLDPAHASSRLAGAVESGYVDVCITRPGLLSDCPPGLQIVSVDDSCSGPVLSARSPSCIDPEDLAYVMPTSGSTGSPNLVGVPHRAVARLVANNVAFPLSPSDSTALVANTSFDAATFELWGALCNGGTVVIPDNVELEDPHLLCRMIERKRITVAFFTVTLFARLLDAEPQRLRGMRHLLVGGEAVPPRLVERALKVIGPGVLVNGYGPTENTTFSCTYRVDSTVGHFRTLPLGRAIGNSGVRVLDANLRPCPVGVAGEIVVTGAGLAVGYLNDPKLTAERFIVLEGQQREPAYLTGDLGRLLPSGDLEYLGRVDRQLKVRGFRVEPGEVEAALEGHSSVSRAVVFAQDTPYETRLLAAVQADGIDAQALRLWVRGMLPSYLIPDRVLVVDQLPMTANGKLDVTTLIKLAQSKKPPRVEATGNRTVQRVQSELEFQALTAWREALGIENLQLEDDVFDAGASSMSVLAVVAKLTKILGFRVPAHIVYEHHSAGPLAQWLEENANGANTLDGTSGSGGAEARMTRAEERAAKIRRSGRTRR